MKALKFFLPLVVLLCVPSLAQAHVGPEVGGSSGFLSGFTHPLGGLDHLCAMLAVGLWATQMGGRALWAGPLAFVALMAVGGTLGMMGVGLPLVEPTIVLSVFLLGVLIATTVRLPLAASITIIGFFAIFHGHAHGTEMAGAASGLATAGGFLLATALLHLSGIGLGLGSGKITAAPVVRFAGAAIAVAGTFLWLA